MGYCKGCDVVILSNYILKKFDKGSIVIADSLKDSLTIEKLRESAEALKTDYVDKAGNQHKGVPSGYIYALLKKIDKQKTLLGIVTLRRVAGEPSGKTGIAAWFESSPDSYVAEDRFFAPDFEEESKFFDEAMLNSLKDYVGLGQVKEADYFDKMVIMAEKKSFMGSMITKSAYFIFMAIIWSVVFKNIGVGICFAFLFTMSFTMITSKVDTKTENSDYSSM